MKYSNAIYLFTLSMLALSVKSSPSEISDDELYSNFLDDLNENGVSFKRGVKKLCSDPGYVCVQVHSPNNKADWTKYNFQTLNGGTMQCGRRYSFGAPDNSTTGYTGTCVGKPPLEVLMTCSKGNGDSPAEEKGFVYINFSTDDGINHVFDAREETSARFGLDKGNKNKWETFDRSATSNQVNVLCPYVDEN